MNQTQNLHLPQWEASDRILHDDFNAAMANIDTVVAGMAETLNSGVKLAFGKYTGSNLYGSQHPNTLTFSFKPKVVLLFNGDANSGLKAPMLLVYPDKRQDFVLDGSAGGYEINVTWGENSVSWYSTQSVKAQINSSYGKNFYIALG